VALLVLLVLPLATGVAGSCGPALLVPPVLLALLTPLVLLELLVPLSQLSFPPARRLHTCSVQFFGNYTKKHLCV